MFPVTRPKRGETEEDLLRQQEEFLRSKGTPSAQVIKKPDKRRSGEAESTTAEGTEKDVVDLGGLPGQFAHTTTAPPVKKSRFKERRDRRKAQPEFDADEQIERDDTHITKVLTEIVERDIQNIPVYYPDASTLHGFPVAPHRGDTESSGAKAKKKSIFAQQFAKASAGDFGLTSKPAPRLESMITDEKSRLAKHTGSLMITGQGLNPTQASEESRIIHEENVAKMYNMSENEILQEQQKLMEGLDPSLLAFFKSKSEAKNSRKPSSPTEMEVDQVMTEEPVDETRDPNISMNTDHILKEKVQPTLPEAPVKRTDSKGQSLPIKPTKKWQHMDKVESDKLEWMKDLPPPPKADNTTTGKPARFDFSGSLVAVDADLSTQMGLHHHGNEPERAGYTLEELFQLARSANMQQRVVALTTIARILQKAKDGLLTEYVQNAIIPALLDGGLIYLLRWALDDSTDNTMAAAIYGFHSLLVCQQDEAGADRAFCWHQGSSAPSLQPPPTAPPPDDEEQKETDAEVLKNDVIKGLLRMQFLQRLRYILEVWKPPAAVVIHILEILTRIARHSAQSAYEISQCPRLMDTIFKEFLPTTWTSVDQEGPMSDVHGFPVPEAMKLVRVICAAGTNLAASLVSNSWLMTSISRYIVEEPNDLQLPSSVASHLQVESLRTWRLVTLYGLASSSFSELYPVVMRSLQGLPALSHVPNPSLHRWGEAMLGVLESVVALAATAHQLNLQQSAKVDSAPQMNVSPAVPAVNWSHVTGLFQPVELCLQNTLKGFTEDYPTKKHDLSFASCCVNFVATYINKMDSQPGYSAIEWLDHLERLSSSCLLPCLTSVAFQGALNSVREHSLLLNPEKLVRREMSSALPEHGALISDMGELCPLLKEESPMHFILALIRLLVAIGRTHKDLATKLYPNVLQAEDLVLYVRRSCQVKHTPNSSHPYVRYENLLQYYLLQMARINPSLCDAQLFHQMSLFVLPRIHQGNEHLAHDLLSNVIFNQHFFGDLVNAEVSALSELELLQLTDNQPKAIGSATQRVTVASREQLAADITEHLAGMRGSYLASSAGLIGNVQRSRWRMLMMPQQTESLLLGPVGQLVAPIDWPFLPLVELFNHTCHEGGASENTPSPQMVSLVTDSLRFIYALERWRPGVLDSIKFVTKLTRLMCTFLAGNDLFLDSGVHVFLEAILKLYCRPVFLERMDFTKRVPGLISFYDFYVQFLTQFEAVSFGDSLFACYLLLPLQQRHSLQMRRALWTEHISILRVLSIPLNEVPIPLDNFLHPDETDVELIRHYYQALYSGSVTVRWSPLLYLVAVHHVNRFLYLQERENRKLRFSMIQQLENVANQSLTKDILYYKKSGQSGMEYYTELPAVRQAMLREAQTTQSS